MLEDIKSTVNAEPVANVEPQITADVQKEQPANTEQAEPEKAQNVEVAEPQQDKKPVQTPEENAKFAEMRRAREAAEAKAVQIERDYSISKTYGSEWGVHSEADIADKYGHLGITTLQQFEEAVRAKEMADKGIDQQQYEQFIENDPRIKKAKEITAQEEQKQRLSKEWQEFSTEFPDVKLEDIPQEVFAETQKGKPLADAYARYEIRRSKEQQKVESANVKNSAASTGSVKESGATEGYFTREQVDAMSIEQINKNYKAVMASMKTWK